MCITLPDLNIAVIQNTKFLCKKPPSPLRRGAPVRLFDKGMGAASRSRGLNDVDQLRANILFSFRDINMFGQLGVDQANQQGFLIHNF